MSDIRMPVLGLGPKTIAVIGIGLFVAFYIDNSPPSFSRELTTWMTKGKFMVYRGQKIFYREEKSKRQYGDGLLCLHGFPTSSFDWLKMWPSLLTRFGKVVAPDFIGFGLSDKPQRHTYSIMEQADIIEALMEQLNIKKAHVLAHDYGDTVAQELLARHHLREINNIQGFDILSVTLLNGGIFPETNFPIISQKILLIPYLNQILARLMNIYTFRKSLGAVFGPETQPTANEYNDFWAGIKNNDGNIVMPKILSYVEERKTNRGRWVKALQETDVPVQVVYGPSDIVNPPGFVDVYKKLIPHSDVQVLDDHIGHYPQWEAPKETMQAINIFLKSIQKRDDLYEDHDDQPEK